MDEEKSYTPETLPKPFEELTAAEMVALFPVPKPPIPVVETERGLAVVLSPEAAADLGRIASGPAPRENLPN